MARGDTLRMTIGGLVLMPIRGLLLWIVVPLALVIWPLAGIVSKATQGRWVTARQSVRFGDDLLTATLGNTIARPFLGPCPWPWQPGGEGLGGPVLLGLW